MLVFRLTRIGKKNRPTYRIVVAEKTAPIQGKFVEIVGNYDPITKKIVLKKDLVMCWLEKGVKPTNTVAKIFTKENIKHKLVVVKIAKKKTPKKKGEETEEAKVAQTDTKENATETEIEEAK